MAIKESGNGKKYDNDKPPVYQGLFQYFPLALDEVASISGYGAVKYELEYDDVNWARVPNGFNRYSDALGRHLTKEFSEGEMDGESGFVHAAHVAWNALARLELLLRNKQKEVPNAKEEANKNDESIIQKARDEVEAKARVNLKALAKYNWWCR